MAEYFAGGHLRFLEGEWRNDNGDVVDVKEAKYGEWVPVQYTYFGLKRYECSECKDDEYWQKRYLEHKEKYCPNCGAKMDGEEIKERFNCERECDA